MFIAVGKWQFKLLQTQFVKHHIIGFFYIWPTIFQFIFCLISPFNDKYHEKANLDVMLGPNCCQHQGTVHRCSESNVTPLGYPVAPFNHIVT